MPKGHVRADTGSYGGCNWLQNCTCDGKGWDQSFSEMQDLQATGKAGAEQTMGLANIILTCTECEPDRREMFNVLKTDDDTGTLTTGEPLHMDAVL